MKTANLLLLFGLICMVTISVQCSKSDSQHTDLDIFKLKGKVKSFTLTSYEAEDKFGVLEMGKMTFKEIYSFNMDGNFLSNKLIDNDNKLVAEDTYKYNTDGQLIEKTSFRTSKYDFNTKDILEGSFTTIGKYTYDANGELIEFSTFTNDNMLESKCIYVYDDKGNIIEINIYNSDGSLKTKTKLVYNNEGVVIKKDVYTSDGNLDSRVTYKYNPMGEVTEETWFDSEGDFDNAYIRKYDKMGLMIEEVDSSSIDTDKNIYKFEKLDEKGNWTYSIEISTFFESTEIIVREIEYY